jgi:hypothetical protein
MVVTIFGMVMAFLWGGLQAVFLILSLGVLEISISFDNAVVNANELQRMSPLWQKRFLIWGILIAVFVVRFSLPIMMVSLVTQLNIFDVFKIAFKAPHEYSTYLTDAQAPMSAFGGIFLLLVFLSFLFEQRRTHFWLGSLERALNKFGKVASIKIVISVFALFIIQQIAPSHQQFKILISGILGIICFTSLKILTNSLRHRGAKHHSKGLVQFLYLETLDASFSLDGVITAFAITKDIVIILIGLAIGAVFVRSMTLSLIHHKTLKKFVFLEHSAFYASGVLAIIMLITVKFHIPEIIIALITVVIIFLGFLSSIYYNHAKQKPRRFPDA